MFYVMRGNSFVLMVSSLSTSYQPLSGELVDWRDMNNEIALNQLENVQLEAESILQKYLILALALPIYRPKPLDLKNQI